MLNQSASSGRDTSSRRCRRFPACALSATPPAGRPLHHLRVGWEFHGSNDNRNARKSNSPPPMAGAVVKDDACGVTINHATGWATCASRPSVLGGWRQFIGRRFREPAEVQLAQQPPGQVADGPHSPGGSAGRNGACCNGSTNRCVIATARHRVFASATHSQSILRH